MENQEQKNIFENIHYDAFISYRHNRVDEYVAKTLQEMLETYVVPENVKDNINKDKISRIFRDQDELPLSDNLGGSIENALKNSEYLIVIASPSYRESKWCMKEIDTFIKLHGYGKIIVVLTEGTTQESFPPQLLSADTEPFASDVRGKDFVEISKKLKSEHVRVAASLLGVPYESLRQREQERIMLRKMKIASYAALGLGAIALLATIALVKINVQKKSLEKNQAETLVEEAVINFESGDNNAALQCMVEADDIYSTSKKKYQDVLTKILRVYDNTANKKSVNTIELNAPIKAVKSSESGRYIMISDENGCIKVFDTDDNNKEVYAVSDVYKGLTYTVNEGFMSETTIYYLNDRCKLISYNFINDTIENEAIINSIDKINTYLSPQKGYLAIIADRYVAILDTKKWELFDAREILDNEFYGPKDDGNPDKTLQISDYAGFLSEDLFLYSTCDKRVNTADEIKANHNEKLCIVNCATKQEYYSVDTGLTCTYNAMLKDNDLYLCSRVLDGNNVLPLTTVNCVNIENLNSQREFSLDNYNVKDIFVTNAGKLLFVSNNSIKWVDENTGNTIDSISLVSGNILNISDSENNQVKIISSMGESIKLSFAGNSISKISQYKEFDVNELRDLFLFHGTSKDLIYGIPLAKTNIANEYKYVPGVKGESVNAEPVEVDFSDGIFRDEAVADQDKEVFSTYGTPYCKLIPGNRSYTVYVFPNGRIITFQRGTGNVIDDKTVGFKVENIVGTDCYENEYYVERKQDKTPGSAIAISKKGYIVNAVDDFVNLTEDGTGIIINTSTENGKEYLSYPIYTYKELINTAKQRLE